MGGGLVRAAALTELEGSSHSRPRRAPARNIEDFLKECESEDGNVQVVPPEMLEEAASACQELELQQQQAGATSSDQDELENFLSRYEGNEDTKDNGKEKK